MLPNRNFMEVDLMRYFDIRPFALPNTPANEVRFEDPRDIKRVVVTFADNAPQDA